MIRVPVQPDRLVATDLPVAFGRYELLEVLGEGSMGRVFRAELQGPAGFRKPVALKVVRAGSAMATGEEAQALLVREARVGGLLRHPNIVDTYDFGAVHGQLYIAMELVDGVGLDRVLKRVGALAPAVVLELAAQIASGLASAHDLEIGGEHAGVVHRDLKPSNVLLTRDGRVKIVDFGIATWRQAQAETDDDTVWGTPPFMSPEQVLGEDLDNRSDIFSFGALLYEMATGWRLFTAGTQPEVCLAVHDVERYCKDHQAFDKVERCVSGLSDVLARCLRFDRELRYAEAWDLADDLSSLARRHARDVSPRTVMRELLAEVEAPAEVTQTVPDISSATATLSSRRTTNLARPANRFVGRSAELDRIAELYDSGCRLVTIKGAPGIGKSRLARRYGRGSLGEVDEVWGCSLEGGELLRSLSDALTVPIVGLDPSAARDTLGRALAARGFVLLVLDAADMALASVREHVLPLLEAAPGTRVLATGRRRMKLDGEKVLELGPLRPSDATKLFDERVSELAVGAKRLARELVDRLEGIPLAIELAAAQLDGLDGPTQMARLEERLDVLDARSVTPDQASLRETLDWSWQQLEPHERSCLAQCAVFADGFQLEAVEEVVDLSAWPDAPWVVYVVESLLEKSLLHSYRTDTALGDTSTGARSRIGLYGPVREYCGQRLAEDPGLAAGAGDRHAAWYGRMGTELALHALSGPGGARRLAVLVAERENLLAAYGHALASDQPEAGVLCCVALHQVMELLGPIERVAQLTAQLLDRSDVPRLGRLRVLLGESRPLALQGDRDGTKRVLRQARALAMELGADKEEGYARAGLADVHLGAGDLASARRNLTRAHAIAGRVGDQRLEAIILLLVGVLNWRQGRAKKAVQHLAAGMALCEELQFLRLEGRMRSTLGSLMMELGRMKEARDHLERGFGLFTALGDQTSASRDLQKLGAYWMRLGQYGKARDYLEAALRQQTDTGQTASAGAVRVSLGVCDREQGRYDDAAEHLETAATMYEEAEAPRQAALVWGHVAALYRAQGRLDEARSQAMASIRALQALGARGDMMDQLVRLGEIELAAGRLERARKHLVDARGYFQEAGHRRGEGRALSALGEVFARTEMTEAAQEAFVRALRLLRKTGDVHEVVKALLRRARLHRDLGELDRARAWLAKAEDLLAELELEQEAFLGREVALLRGEL